MLKYLFEKLKDDTVDYKLELLLKEINYRLKYNTF